MYIFNSTKLIGESAMHGLFPRAVVADVANPTLAFYDTTADGVWRTTDGGVNWSRAGDEIPHGRITTVSLDSRADSEDVWIGAEPSGIYRSRDGGEMWT